MELAVIEGIISNVGFPIAVCGALFWMQQDNAKRYERILSEYRTLLDNNTQAINNLAEQIRKV